MPLAAIRMANSIQDIMRSSDPGRIISFLKIAPEFTANRHALVASGLRRLGAHNKVSQQHLAEFLRHSFGRRQLPVIFHEPTVDNGIGRIHEKLGGDAGGVDMGRKCLPDEGDRPLPQCLDPRADMGRKWHLGRERTVKPRVVLVQIDQSLHQGIHQRTWVV